MRRLTDVVFLMVTVAVVACSSSGSSSGGCASLGPIPGGAYTGAKTDNAVNLQLSPEGINYINNNWQQLVNLLAPGGTLQLPVNCTSFDEPSGLVGKLWIADQGNASGAGRMDQSCNGDVPATVDVTITGLQLTPTQPDKLTATVSVMIDTHKIYIDSDDRSLGECLYLSGINASVDFNTASNSPNYNTLAATLQFSISQKFDERLAFKFVSLDGTQVCGASGAPGMPECLDPNDISLNGENNCGSVYLTILDWGPIKNFVLKLLSPTLQTQIQGLLGKEVCQQCGMAGMPACPTGSTCTSGICQDNSSSDCVPRFLGVEGRVDLGTAMANFGVQPGTALDLSIAAGSSFSIDTVSALNIGTRGGMAASMVAPCVPMEAAPPLIALTAPDFRGEAPPVTMTNPPYHMALGVSSPFLNLALNQAEQGGALCLQLNNNTVGLLTTGLFKTFLPSLGKLATRDGKDAPVMVVLRPGKAPTAKVGAGGTSPLITIAMPDLTIDFYAMIDDRFARLFSLTADIVLPLQLTFSGCTSVTPAIGDLNMLITNIRTGNAEMLAEDPSVLADLIPAVIGLAQPALASALKPIDLPSLGAFKLKVNAAKGVGNISGTMEYNHLALYATMLPNGAACATVTPRTSAQLIRSEIPNAAEMRLQGKPLPLPKAVIAVGSAGVKGTPEYSYRVDGSLWTAFAGVKGDLLEVAAPQFLIQGRHLIEVRSRVAEDPHGVSEGIPVPFFVDWDPPAVSFAADRLHDRLVLTAHDVLTPDEKLTYSYRTGDGAWSAYGPARVIVLSAIEQEGGVTARVRDEVGNVGEIAWRVPTTAGPKQLADGTTVDPIEQRAGCTSAAGLTVLGAVAMLLRSRRRR
jgi:hypothetical protein